MLSPRDGWFLTRGFNKYPGGIKLASWPRSRDFVVVALQRRRTWSTAWQGPHGGHLRWSARGFRV